jgi:hypothetical protein
MRYYEVRLLSAVGMSAPMEVASLTDRAAIRQGRKLAGSRPFEIWKGLDRVYESPNSPRRAKTGCRRVDCRAFGSEG